MADDLENTFETGEDAFDAGGQEVEQASAPPTQETGQNQEQAVPLSALESLRAELQEVKNTNAFLHSQMAGMAAGTMQRQQGPSNPMDLYSDDDVPTFGDIKRIVQQQQQMMQQVNAQYENQLRQQQMLQQYPDYKETVKDLPVLAQKIPGLAEAITTSVNPHLMAYIVGKAAKELMPGQQPAPSGNQQQRLERIVNNANLPRSASMAGSSAGLNAADRYAAMSEEAFLNLVEKVKAGEY